MRANQDQRTGLFEGYGGERVTDGGQFQHAAPDERELGTRTQRDFDAVGLDVVRTGRDDYADGFHAALKADSVPAVGSLGER